MLGPQFTINKRSTRISCT